MLWLSNSIQQLQVDVEIDACIFTIGNGERQIGETYDIAEGNDVEESGRALGGGGVVGIVVGEDSGGLAHRVGELNQFFDCFHRRSDLPKHLGFRRDLI